MLGSSLPCEPAEEQVQNRRLALWDGALVKGAESLRMKSRLESPVSRCAAMLMAVLVVLVASTPGLAASGLCVSACGGMAHPVTAASAADSHAGGAPIGDGGAPAADTGCALDCCTLCAPVLISAPRLPAGEPIGLTPFAVPARAADSLHDVPTLPPPRLRA